MPCVCPIGLTLLYMTARTPDSQTAALQELSVARQLTDQSLADVSVWPGSADEGEMFRADYLFAAVLDNSRSRVKTGDYFWKELDVCIISFTYYEKHTTCNIVWMYRVRMLAYLGLTLRLIVCL